jgi:flagellin
VDLGNRTYEAGGVCFTVSQASTLDVGLTSYLKANTYIAATKDDKSLTFQVGPDEGNVTRVGIGRMDVDTIFRRTELADGSNEYGEVDLSNALRAQDLIGQIDDALNYVGGENLKVGQFQNKFSRTLDLARQQMTSITGALSNLNDADMAREATNQSKRSILVQSGTAMVAQANSQGQFLLQLLR